MRVVSFMSMCTQLLIRGISSFKQHGKLCTTWFYGPSLVEIQVHYVTIAASNWSKKLSSERKDFSSLTALISLALSAPTYFMSTSLFWIQLTIHIIELLREEFRSWATMNKHVCNHSPVVLV